MPTVEAGPQEVARELHVQYYAFFEVRSAGDLHFPMAQIYERGRWRWLVIGGRPYQSSAIAQRLLQDAEQIQEEFLNAMRLVKSTSGFPPEGLTNPLDHWRYRLEHDWD